MADSADSANWLDTQTEAELRKCPPGKLAPPDVDGYSLVLLERGPDRRRVDEAVASLADGQANVAGECPLIVRQNLSLADALVGQFKLICTDSISIFLDDEVMLHGEPAYLHRLFQIVRESDEFATVTVQLRGVPDDEDGRRLLRQFFGQVVGVAATHTMPRKKARIMAHWGAKFGARVAFDKGT